ncbi:atos homolog protein B [Hyperolius riggenbachi]|uniref:atos homolog protein B n=1 Tax=Hyperolius riggenbachi TaxID=752182 RepID=UPI0035A2A5F0
MCHGRRVLAARQGAPHCRWQHTNTQGCRSLWSLWGSCKPLERGCPLVPSSRGQLPWSLSVSPARPNIRRHTCVGSMRHIQMDTSPKEEAEGENGEPAPVDSLFAGQAGVFNVAQDCRVVVGYPETEHKLQKVYHVSISSDMPGPKAICRQALKRSAPDPPPEPARSPRRAMWGPSKSDVPPGHGEYPSGSLMDDEDDQDIFEDGLLSEEMPMCSSAQHFSHSGLRVIEHRAEGFASKDAPDRRLTSPPLPKVGSRRTEHRAPLPCTTLHINSPKERQLGNSEGLSAASETNGNSISTDPRPSGASTSNQHILDLDLHNIARTETLVGRVDQDSPGSSHSCANGNIDDGGTSKEHFTACVEDGKLQAAASVEDLASLERTPPGVARLCAPGGSGAAVKRKLLPSSETGESCSEDEAPGKRWRGGESCRALHGSCRSTDSKGAPFWNHLLPSSRNAQKTPSDCTSRRLKRGLRLKSRTLRSLRKSPGRSCAGNWATSCVSRALLGNFEESILKGRFAPSGQIEGFTAEIGASGSYCPQHVTLPVEVTYFHISEHSAPSPFLGVIDLDGVGRKGYNVPSTGTIQVTLFNPNKTVVKMFLVTYDFKDMPVNHVTFLRHRIFLVPVQESQEENGGQESANGDAAKEKAKRILCYLMHLRFQRSKSGKIYLNEDIRLLFSRKSIELDTGIPYELKSFTEAPKNPKYSPRA